MFPDNKPNQSLTKKQAERLADPFEIVQSILNPPIFRVAAKCVTTIALRRDNRVLIFGGDHKTPPPQRRQLTLPVPPGERVIDIEVDSEHLIALCSDGSVIVFGDNKFGQLGLGPHINYQPEPKRLTLDLLPPGVRVTKIASGHSGYSLLVCSDNSVIVFGNNCNSQLGLGHCNNVFNPVRLPLDLRPNEHIIDISLGCQHTWIWCSDNKLLVFGSTMYGELGATNFGSLVMTPRLLNLSLSPGANIAGIATGLLETLIWCTDNTVFIWGSMFLESLGYDSLRPEPHKLELKLSVGQSITKIVVGYCFAVIQLNDQTFLGFGKNERGQLGLGPEIIYQRTPTPLKLPVSPKNRIIDIAAGSDYTIILLSDNTALVFGSNEWGQLGLGDTNNRYVPTKLTFYPADPSKGSTETIIKTLTAVAEHALEPQQIDNLITILASGLIRAILSNLPVAEVTYWLQPQEYRALYNSLFIRLKIELAAKPKAEQARLFTSHAARRALYDSLLGPADTYHDDFAVRLSTLLKGYLSNPMYKVAIGVYQRPSFSFATQPNKLAALNSHEDQKTRIADAWFTCWLKVPSACSAIVADHFKDVIKQALLQDFNDANLDQLFSACLSSVANEWDGTSVGLARLLKANAANMAGDNASGAKRRRLDGNEATHTEPEIFSWFSSVTSIRGNNNSLVSTSIVTLNPNLLAETALSSPTRQFKCQGPGKCDCDCHRNKPTACTCLN